MNDHSVGFGDPYPVQPLGMDVAAQERRQLRVEALRAASNITRITLEEVHEGRHGYSVQPVLDVAEKLVRWLETGEQ